MYRKIDIHGYKSPSSFLVFILNKTHMEAEGGCLPTCLSSFYLQAVEMTVLNWRLEKSLLFKDPYSGNCRGEEVGVGWL